MTMLVLTYVSALVILLYGASLPAKKGLSVDRYRTPRAPARRARASPSPAPPRPTPSRIPRAVEENCTVPRSFGRGAFRGARASRLWPPTTAATRWGRGCRSISCFYDWEAHADLPVGHGPGPLARAREKFVKKTDDAQSSGLPTRVEKARPSVGGAPGGVRRRAERRRPTRRSATRSSRRSGPSPRLTTSRPSSAASSSAPPRSARSTPRTRAPCATPSTGSPA